MAGRRANGEGALFQRETGRHAGKWIARITIEGPNGKPKHVDRMFAKQAEAKAYLREQLNNIAKGRAPIVSSQSLGDYLESWLEHRVRPRVGRNTYDRYRSAVRTHVLPDQVATMPIASLNPKALNDLIDRRRALGAKPPTLHNIRVTLNVALHDAVHEELIHDNPAAKIPVQKRTRQEVRFLTPEQTKALFDAAKNHEVLPLLVVATRTGMRLSELLGLTWDCVDFANRKVTIKQQLQRHDGKFYLAETKTAGTRRTVTVSPAVIEQLKVLKGQELLGKSPGEDSIPNLVFRTKTGTPYHRKTILDWTNKFMEEAEIPAYGFHALRHTCASILINGGADPLRVQRHLGHSNVRVTMSTYAHLFEERLEENHDILDRALS